MNKLAVLAIGATLALAACSGGSQSAEPTTTQAPTTTAAPITTTVVPPTTMPPTTMPPTTEAPTTPTTIDPMETARLAYAGLTGELNPALAAANEKYGTPTTKTVRAECAELAPIVERFANAIRDGDWPQSVKDEADTLSKSEAADTGHLYACANAATGSAAIPDWNAYIDNATGPGSAAASAMRLALGLPIDR